MRIPLLGGAYANRSIIAAAQRCINLYPESNSEAANPPVPVTHYQTPGLTRQATAPNIANYRCLYRATNGELFGVVGAKVYYIDTLYAFTELGTIVDGVSPVSMSDNGLAIVIVDGTATGYAINLSSHAFGTISATNFYGATRVDFMDTYFLFNRPGTTQFYISLSNVTYAMLLAGTAFDPLDIAGKSGGADPLQTIIALHREIWLPGSITSEVWVNTGAADFTFGALPGAFIEHGCVAPYSLAKQDLSNFWLSQDLQGQGIIVRSNGYQVSRISTHSMEAEIQGYTKITDAIGYTYQLQGHAFYVLIFPSADVTWQYEMQTGEWNQLSSIDNNGVLHRHRSNCYAFAYGKNLVGDYSNGKLYSLEQDVYTDDGMAIPRIRTFPVLVKDGDRVFYKDFTADIQVGTITGRLSTNPALVSLRWSDDWGASYGNAVFQELGSTGEYRTTPNWNRLGMARGRVFELSWSEPANIALNGAFVTYTVSKS